MLFRDKDGDTVGREREKESRKGRNVSGYLCMSVLYCYTVRLDVLQSEGKYKYWVPYVRTMLMIFELFGVLFWFAFAFAWFALLCFGLGWVLHYALT